MKKHKGGPTFDYATSTCVRKGRAYAVVWSVTDGRIVSWCVNQAEAQLVADRLNARTSHVTVLSLLSQVRQRQVA
jgi:hypothetical protein